MLWLKSFHIIFMVIWFTGLFYLPRLFVYHAMTEDAPGNERFKIMERKLFYAITTPGAILTIGTGLWLMWGYGFAGGWLTLKIALTALLVVYHVTCGKYLVDFKHDRNRRSHTYYRWFNEASIALMVGSVLLVEFQPF